VIPSLRGNNYSSLFESGGKCSLLSRLFQAFQDSRVHSWFHNLSSSASIPLLVARVRLHLFIEVIRNDVSDSYQ
jgi:hypothetical protein